MKTYNNPELQKRYKDLLKCIHFPIKAGDGVNRSMNGSYADKSHNLHIDYETFEYDDINKRNEDYWLFKKMNTVKVVFRKFNEGIIALFPEIPETNYCAMSYMHVGQHGAADYQQCVAISKPANENEYQDLKQELESLGYDLKVVKKAKINYSKK